MTTAPTRHECFLALLRRLSVEAGLGFNRRVAEASGMSEQFVGRIVGGRQAGGERSRERVAAALGWQYDDFIRLGRAVLDGTIPEGAPIEAPPPPEMDQGQFAGRGFVCVPYSAAMRLVPGRGRNIPITEGPETSPVAVCLRTLGLGAAARLQAFRLDCATMEPLIARGAVVVCDVADREPERLREGGIYVLCPDPDEGACVANFLWWAERGKTLVISSPDGRANPPVVRRVGQIKLVGRVVSATVEFG